MDNKKNQYETLFAVDIQNGEEAAKETVAKFVDIIGKNAENVQEIEGWGKRRFAYPINYKNEGFYALVAFDSAPGFPTELRRLFGIDERVMRFIVTKREA